MVIVLTGIVLLVMLLGLALLVRGWRGRQIDDHPLCSGCGYDLAGSDNQTFTCPECGNDLARRGSQRIGHRRRNPIALTFGALLLMLMSRRTTEIDVLMCSRVMLFAWEDCVCGWHASCGCRFKCLFAFRHGNSRFAHGNAVHGFDGAWYTVGECDHFFFAALLEPRTACC